MIHVWLNSFQHLVYSALWDPLTERKQQWQSSACHDLGMIWVYSPC